MVATAALSRFTPNIPRDAGPCSAPAILNLSSGDCTTICRELVLERRVLGMAEKPTVRGDVPKGEYATKSRAETQRPSLYKVLLLNDDYTPMEFVIHVLERFFSRTGGRT